MSKFGSYMLRTSERETAYARYNASSTGLELAQIKERLAEIDSQHEPLASLSVNGDKQERKRLYAAAHYVVSGRMPVEGGAD